jgi:hypothetical protein
VNQRILRAVRRPVVATGLAVPLVALAAFGAHAELSSSGPTTDAATSDAGTSGQSTDAHAIVVNHGDNRYRYAITLKIVHTYADTVDPQNAAIAVAANCTDCKTVAISMEGILVFGDPSVFAPENLALAYNQNCTNCQTLAAAFQEEVQTDGKVRITGKGRQQIAAIRQDLESIRHSDLSLAEIDAKVDADAGQLLDVLRHDIVPIGKQATTVSPDASASNQPSGAAGTTQSSPTADPTESPSSTASPEPSGSATPSSSSTP